MNPSCFKAESSPAEHATLAKLRDAGASGAWFAMASLAFQDVPVLVTNRDPLERRLWGTGQS